MDVYKSHKIHVSHPLHNLVLQYMLQLGKIIGLLKPVQ